ncbi:hypothetical protein Ddye_001394 [Dipteronia dyeriana]|uniref:DUF4283 domain-containing protein n=1 Tax=Dipteronia dyeriana TaxID=168575 RepID=A0AAD9XNU7_9ROSI|nr:hypothetical protein Ddye_001394 [Dipteronia dyeriana]
MFLGRLLRAKVASFGWKRRRSSLSYCRKSKAFEESLGREWLRSGHPRQNFSAGNRSFADVLRGYQKVFRSEGERKGFRIGVERREVEMRTMNWSSQKIDQVWIKRCAVGILKQFSNVSSVNKRLRCRGFKFISAYIGDKSILWCLDSESEKERFMRNRFFWDGRFSSVVNWLDSIIPHARAAWIDINGVPLCFWDQKLFMKLGWMIGEPLLVDEETCSRNRFDRVRILVLLPFNHHCCCDMNVAWEEVPLW